MGVALRQDLREAIIAMGLKGMTPLQIHQAVGPGAVTRGTVYSVLRQAREAGEAIPRHATGCNAGRAATGFRFQIVITDRGLVTAIEAHARRRRVSPRGLALNILTAVLQDGIVDAVLDDGVVTPAPGEPAPIGGPTGPKPGYGPADRPAATDAEGAMA